MISAKLQTYRNFIVLFISLSMITGCTQKDAPIIEVENDITHEIIVGKVVPFSTSFISPRTSGELVSILVKKGDSIKKGQLLGQINDQDIQNQLEIEMKAFEKLELQKQNAAIYVKQLQIELEKAKKQVEQSKISYDDVVPMNGASIDKSKLKIQWEDALKIRNKMKVLYEEGAISEQEYLQAVSSEQIAMLALKEAELAEKNSKIDVDLALLTADGAKEELNKALLAEKDVIVSMEQSRLKIKQLQNTLNDAKIKATQDGELYEIHFEIGETVAKQQTLFEIATLNPVIVEVELTPEQLPLIKKEANMDIEIPALNKKTTGKVTFVSSIANKSDLYIIELVVENDGLEIKPGMPANLLITP
ncbi:MAG TPA: HlyD family efflux transporter periplasmic adaptor subunit [Bacillus bacterium]|nr:HlyD family efflux transporter periplasmic adaptor subunit [Bacillus sp. (in: firmicutes)]